MSEESPCSPAEGSRLVWSTVALVATGLLLSASAFAQGPAIYNPNAPRGRALNVQRSPLLPVAQIVNGKACTTITFEGVGDFVQVPTFDGISSPNWLGIVESKVGGSGNFSFEPSPVTIAFWYGGATSARNIQLTTPASSLSFSYSSYVPVTMVAYDKDNIQVASAYGPANYDSVNQTFDFWSPLSLTVTGNQIK